jgi:hypothetical protein
MGIDALRKEISPKHILYFLLGDMNGKDRFVFTYGDNRSKEDEILSISGEFNRHFEGRYIYPHVNIKEYHSEKGPYNGHTIDNFVTEVNKQATGENYIVTELFKNNKPLDTMKAELGSDKTNEFIETIQKIVETKSVSLRKDLLSRKYYL